MDRLIWIAKSNTSFWCKESKLQAQIELDKRKVSNNDQNNYWIQINAIKERQLENEYKQNPNIKVKQNGLDKYEKYSYFFLAPFYLIMGRYFSTMLFVEKNKNRNKQVIILILSGFLFWIIVLMLAVYTFD